MDKGHELYQFYYFCKNNKIFITFRFSHDIIMSGDDNLLYHFRLLTVCFKKMGTRVSLQSLNLIFADVMTDRNESLDQRFFREMAKMRNVCLLLMYITARYGLCHSCAKNTFYLWAHFLENLNLRRCAKNTYSLLALYISSSLSSLCVLTQIGITF